MADYIVSGGDRNEFLEKFKNAISEGFDPDVHLKKVGLANQTTMYKRETKAIGRIFEVAMLKKFGPADLAVHYSEFDTICDATQERQDAITDIVEAKGKGEDDLDFVLIVGGFDSAQPSKRDSHMNGSLPTILTPSESPQETLSSTEPWTETRCRRTS